MSVASADPKKDAKAILAPLSKDIKGGKSSSMADFDELYSQVETSAMVACRLSR